MSSSCFNRVTSSLPTVPPAVDVVPPTGADELTDALVPGVTLDELDVPEPLTLVLLPGVPLELLEPAMLYFCSSSLTFALSEESCCLTCSRSVLLTVVDAVGVFTVLVLDVLDVSVLDDGAAVFVGGVAGVTT